LVKAGAKVMEIEERPVNKGVSAKTSRREAARKRRTEHEIAYKSVQNPCSPFFGRSPISAPESPSDSTPEIRCRSSVVEHPLGKGEAVGSIPTGSTTQRGELAEAMIAAKLIRLGAGVFTPAYGHDHPFDVIAHWNGFLSRIQVKAARDGEGGSILINGQGVVDRAGGKQYPAITAAACDVIVGYHPETDVAYVIRPVGKTRYQLRRNPARNGQVIGIMYEADFRLVSLDQIKPLPKP
jgi:PD-(D/E)XK endonuclease